MRSFILGVGFILLALNTIAIARALADIRDQLMITNCLTMKNEPATCAALSKPKRSDEP